MGIDKAVKIFKKYKDRPIFVYFDPDVDGLMSGMLICKYLAMLGLQYKCYVNPKRAHGYKIPHDLLKGYLVIAVDFAITREELKSIISNDIALISLDHHDVESELIYEKSDSTEGIVLNNQYPFEPEEDRYLSGAGVVFETIARIDERFNTAENRAVVGITLLSDARPISNDKAKEYLRTVYTFNPSQGYIAYLLNYTVDKDYGFGAPRMDRNFIDYSFSPRINAMLRFGYETEAINFVLGAGLEIPILRQAQKDVIAELKNNMKVLDLPSIKIVVVREDDCIFKTPIDVSCFIGLLCSNIKGNGKSVFAFVIKNGVITRASFRGEFDDVDYRQGFVDIGIDAQGHHGAFGIVNFTFDDTTWVKMNDLVAKLNSGHKPSATIITASNLSYVLNRPIKKSNNTGVAQNGNVSSNSPTNKLIGKPLLLSAIPDSGFVNTIGFEIASNNCYVRDIDRTYIRYTGSNYTVAINKPNYIEYLVDGRKVKCFNPALNPSNSLILPMIEKGYLTLYIKEDILN